MTQEMRISLPPQPPEQIVEPYRKNCVSVSHCLKFETMQTTYIRQEKPQ